ncbi:MAG: nucleotidyltransferase family protein, partial [Candidatus Hydrogenedentes bacterium]|nr:nucleotidyltransferase family protein [Candidatus Hydrogenedentota bacterium]
MSTDPDKRLHSLEWRVLLAAAREAPAPQLAGVLLEAASEVLHPERFVAHCLSTKTYPLAQSALRDARAFEHNTRFGPALSALRQKTFQAWLPRRSRLCSTQRKLHEGLDSAAVPHVFLRGPRFAERYYRQPELRVSDDLDLLVRREDLSRTALVLRELGFTHEQDQQVRVAKALYQGQITWRRTQDGTLLDLNWRLTANAGVGPVEQD